MSYSDDLIWACVRNNSCFLRKGRKPNATFSTERGNLTGKNSFKYSGLANSKTIDLRADGDALVLTTKVKDIAKVARKVRSGGLGSAWCTRVCAAVHSRRASAPGALGARPWPMRAASVRGPSVCLTAPSACARAARRWLRSPSR